MKNEVVDNWRQLSTEDGGGWREKEQRQRAEAEGNKGKLEEAKKREREGRRSFFIFLRVI